MRKISSNLSMRATVQTGSNAGKPALTPMPRTALPVLLNLQLPRQGSHAILIV
jgi:hypothetical protein